MCYLLNLIYLFVFLLLSPWLIYKALRAGKYRRGMWSKITGNAFLRQGADRCVWFHGVSVGEIHLLGPVVKRFRERHPDWECVVSSSTETGLAEAGKRFPDLAVFVWPLDFSWAVRRALRHVKPELVVLAEGEIWPNFVLAAKSLGVTVGIINGRMSPRSYRCYRRVGRPVAKLMHQLDFVVVQTEEFARYFRALGAPEQRVHVTGSVKYDGVVTDRRNVRTENLRRLFGIGLADPVWVAGSTQAPEEQLAIDIFRRVQDQIPQLRFILVPRQKDRFEEVTSLLKKNHVPFVRRSELHEPPETVAPVILVDTIGELEAIWGLADVAFVGGSLDGRRGGQNMIEPAAYGAAVLFGPDVWNFRDTAQRLERARAAIQVADARELERRVFELFQDPIARGELGARAQQLVKEQQGATGRTLAALEHLSIFERVGKAT